MKLGSFTLEPMCEWHVAQVLEEIPDAEVTLIVQEPLPKPAPDLTPVQPVLVYPPDPPA